jgi:hypothetical protein
MTAWVENNCNPSRGVSIHWERQITHTCFWNGTLLPNHLLSLVLATQYFRNQLFFKFKLYSYNLFNCEIFNSVSILHVGQYFPNCISCPCRLAPGRFSISLQWHKTKRIPWLNKNEEPSHIVSFFSS